MIREIITNTILEGRKLGLTDDELSTKIINRLDTHGLGISGNGWLDNDDEYSSILKNANSKLLNPILNYELTFEMFQDAGFAKDNFLHDRLTIDGIKNRISSYDDIMKVKYLSHMSTLMLNEMINGSVELLISKATQCRKEIYDLIVEIRKNN